MITKLKSFFEKLMAEKRHQENVKYLTHLLKEEKEMDRKQKSLGNF